MRLTHGVVGAQSGVRVGLFIHEIIAGPRIPVTRVYGSSGCKARAFRPLLVQYLKPISPPGRGLT